MKILSGKKYILVEKKRDNLTDLTAIRDSNEFGQVVNRLMTERGKDLSRELFILKVMDWEIKEKEKEDY